MNSLYHWGGGYDFVTNLNGLRTLANRVSKDRSLINSRQDDPLHPLHNLDLSSHYLYENGYYNGSFCNVIAHFIEDAGWETVSNNYRVFLYLLLMDSVSERDPVI